MSQTKKNQTAISVIEKANAIIKSTKDNEVSFSDDERSLIRGRFQSRLKFWTNSFFDIDSIDNDEMLEHLKKWNAEINYELRIGSIIGSFNLMDCYYNLDFDFNPEKLPYVKIYPINATINLFEALAAVCHYADVLEEFLVSISKYASLKSSLNSQVNLAHEHYTSQVKHVGRDMYFKESFHIFDCWFFCLIDCMYHSLAGTKNLTSFGLSKEIDSRTFAGSLKHIREAIRYGLRYLSFFPKAMFGYCYEKYVYDAQLRPHNLSGPAFRDTDGKVKYYIKGVEVPEYAVMRPEEITIDKILYEINQEVKSVLLERFGIEKFVSLSNAKVIDSLKDKHGENQLLEIDLGRGEKGFFAKVTCPTTSKEYLLRVPHSSTLKGAIAWTFGMSADEYEPVIET